MLDRADCADFGCHNSIRLETKHFPNTLALTFISFSGRFVFAMQKIAKTSFFLLFCERSSSSVCFQGIPQKKGISPFVPKIEIKDVKGVSCVSQCFSVPHVQNAPSVVPNLAVGGRLQKF